MQNPVLTPAAAAAATAAGDRSPDCYVVRPSGVLAEILGAAELGEDELLLRLRELELITYPSPLLGGLLEKVPEVLAAEVLAQLGPTDLVLFGQVGRACRGAVVAFGVPQEETTSDGNDDEGTEMGGPLLLRVGNFVGSVERLAWAKESGCPWAESICAYRRPGRAPGAAEVCAGVLSRRLGRAPGGAAVGAGARVRVGRADVHVRRSGRPPGAVALGARAWVPVGFIHLSARRGGRAPARAVVCAGARLPVGYEDVYSRRFGRAPGSSEVGAGARLSVDRGDA